MISPGSFIILVSAIVMALDGLAIRNKRETVGCEFENDTISDGATKDGLDFRVTCTNGSLNYDGCMFEGVFVGPNAHYQAAGSELAINCTSDDSIINNLVYYTHCNNNNTLMSDNTDLDEDGFRYHCDVVDDQSTYNLDIIGCIFENQFVTVNSTFQEQGSEVAYNCSYDENGVSSVSYYTHCKLGDDLVKDGESVDDGDNRLFCDVAADGSTYDLNITDCLFTHANATGIHEISVGSSLNVTLSSGIALVNCTESTNGTVHMSAAISNA